MTVEMIRQKVATVAKKYPVKRITLFGSRAEGTNHEDSDVDLIIEFLEPISLLKLSEITIQLEEILGIHVDLIHGPVLKNDLLEVKREVELYAA